MSTASAATGPSAPEQEPSSGGGLSIKAKVAIGLGVYVGLMVLLVVIFGADRLEEAPFQPQNDFRLDPWIELPGVLTINKGVFFVVAAGLLSVVSMLYVGNRMQARPNRVQTAVEWLFTAMRDNVTRENMDERMAAKWFPFILWLFLFIWWSNIIGFVPLPIGTSHPVEIAGVNVPTFALYAATANLSVPLVLAAIVWIGYTVEGVRAKGPIGYLKGLIPAGVSGPMAGFIFVLELISNVMRLVSLSVRLFANVLAGHLIILFMAGGIAVLLGMEVVGVLTLPFGVALYLFEVGLIASLQAFIFATLTAIYLGDAVSHEH